MPRAAASVAALTLLLLVAAPTAAWANAGTPLMWLAMGHLVVGNFLIACVEMFVLWRAMGKVNKGALIWLTLANYLTAFIGFHLFSDFLPTLQPILDGTLPQSRVVPLIALSWTLAFIVTVFLEWPFVWLSLSEEKRAWKRAFRWCLVMHVVSYGALSLLYLGSSDYSMLTDTTIHQDAREFARAPHGTVYYTRSRGLRAISTDGTGDRAVPMLPIDGSSGSFYANLLLRHDQQTPDTVEIWAGSRPSSSSKVQLTPPLNARAGTGIWSRHDMWSDAPRMYASHGFRKPLRSERDFPSMTWYGLSWMETVDGRREWRSLRYESLSGSAQASRATVLPSGQTVFEMNGAIYLLDPADLRLAKLVDGTSPVVVYDPSVLDALDDPNVTWFGKAEEP